MSKLAFTSCVLIFSIIISLAYSFKHRQSSQINFDDTSSEYGRYRPSGSGGSHHEEASSSSSSRNYKHLTGTSEDSQIESIRIGTEFTNYSKTPKFLKASFARQDTTVIYSNEYEEDDVESLPKLKSSKKSKKPKPKEEEDDDDDSNEEDMIQDSPNSPSNTNNDQKPKEPKPGEKKPKGKVVFEEKFSERSWDSRWTYSKAESTGNESKKFEKFFRIRSDRGTRGMDNGLITSNKGVEDYAISALFPVLGIKDGPIVLQFSIQYQATPHCEYVFLKLFDCRFKPEDFNQESPYLMQMGPDICASTDVNQLSVVIVDTSKSEKHQINQNIKAITSTDLHVYSFIIQPDGNFEILTDGKSVQNGSVTTVYPKYQNSDISFCAVGLSVWHSVLDKFFKGQIIIDDILVATDVHYAEKRRIEILGSSTKNYTQE